ncbi:MAG TPA: ferritin-like domain-containing protein [Chitinophagales bacterium]|nr:ferritin-like domain-containing protein [Chitinophagales bacterium]
METLEHVKPKPTLNHPALVDLLQRAYSAEKAAALAYQGHAASVKRIEEKKAIRQIELDEWHHREVVLQIMNDFGVPISKPPGRISQRA